MRKERGNILRERRKSPSGGPTARNLNGTDTASGERRRERAWRYFELKWVIRWRVSESRNSGWVAICFWWKNKKLKFNYA